MRQYFQSVLKTQTLRATTVTVVSTFLTAALGAVFYLLLARYLTVPDYGLFILGMTILQMGASFADLGSNQGVVRFVGQNREGSKYFPYARISLLIKLTTGAASFLLLTLLARPLSLLLFRQPDLERLMPVIGVGLIAQILLSFSISLAQGLQKFWLWGSLQVGANILRLAFFLVVALVFVPSPSAGIIVFALAAVIGFFLSWFWFPLNLVSSVSTADQNRSFWNFTRWTAVFTILSAFVSRLDTLLTGRYLDLSEVGIYGLAAIMVSFMPQLSAALGAVTSAKFASMKEAGQAKKYMSKALLFSTGISAAVMILMIPVALAVIRFTGQDYSRSFVPFLILLSGLFIFTSTNPLRDSLLYYHGRSKVFTFLNLGQGLVLVTAGVFLIPRYGVIGSAVSMLASHIFLATASWWYYRRL